MPRGIPLARGTTQNRAALTPQARGAQTRKANQAARGAQGMRTAAGNKATASKKIALKTATASAGQRTTAGKKAGAKKAQKQNRPAGREAGEERLRPIARTQTLTETIAHIAVHSRHDMGTVRNVLQATQRVAQAHLCRGGSGKINLPFVGVQLYRAQQVARPARTLPLFGTGRTMQLRKSPARAIARARVLAAMRNATLR